MRILTEVQHVRLATEYMDEQGVKVVGWDDEIGGPVLWNPASDTYAILTPSGTRKPTKTIGLEPRA